MQRISNRICRHHPVLNIGLDNLPDCIFDRNFRKNTNKIECLLRVGKIGMRQFVNDSPADNHFVSVP